MPTVAASAVFGLGFVVGSVVVACLEGQPSNAGSVESERTLQSLKE